MHDRDEEIEALLKRALEFWRLKDVVRTGWKLRGVRDPESVADHSWGTAMLTLIFAASARVQSDRAIAIALVHDLAEVEVGDIPRRVHPGADTPDPSEKARREKRAIDRLTSFDHDEPGSLGDTGSLRHVRDLWQEYEENATPEARFVRDMNLIDMCMQAVEYESAARYDEAASRDAFPDYAHLDEFFATSGPRLNTDIGKKMFEVAFLEYRNLREE